jgi:3-hydroxybutyryl-CoA dehydrogenase
VCVKSFGGNEVTVSEIKTVALVGAGVMGQHVGYAALKAGLSLRLFDLDGVRAAATAAKIKGWLAEDSLTAQDVVVSPSLEEAVAGADLIFENVPEIQTLKQDVHKAIEACRDPHAIQGSNASALTPSDIAATLSDPQNFFSMNFCHVHEGERLVEYMGHAATSDDTRERALGWARHMGLVPTVLEREILGYAQNRIWRAIKKEALFLASEGYASIDDIDRGFMLSWSTSAGPFGYMDRVGLASVLRVEEQYYKASGREDDKPAKILTDLVEQGHLGCETGRGFYSYPDPAFEQPGWLHKENDA